MPYWKRQIDDLDLTVECQRYPELMQGRGRRPNGLLGWRYCIKITRFDRVAYFDFWDCLINREANRMPKAGDVLNCINCDLQFCPDTFRAFCDEFGREKTLDALREYRRCRRHRNRLRRVFFTAGARERLNSVCEAL